MLGRSGKRLSDATWIGEADVHKDSVWKCAICDAPSFKAKAVDDVWAIAGLVLGLLPNQPDALGFMTINNRQAVLKIGNDPNRVIYHLKKETYPYDGLTLWINMLEEVYCLGGADEPYKDTK